jgi:hypothetical protein
MNIYNFTVELFKPTTLALVLIVLLMILAFLLWNGVRLINCDMEAERKAAIDRIKARPTTCTPDVIELFDDPSLPEISGKLEDLPTPTFRSKK